MGIDKQKNIDQILNEEAQDVRMELKIVRGKNTFRGNKIREARKARGWTQQQLATRAGCHAPLISVWETGATTPELSSVVKLAGALKKTLGYFYESDKEWAYHPADPDELAQIADLPYNIVRSLSQSGNWPSKKLAVIVEYQDEKIRALEAELTALKKLKGGEE